MGFPRRKHEHLWPRMKIFGAEIQAGTISPNSFKRFVLPTDGAKVGDYVEWAIHEVETGPYGDIQVTAAVTAVDETTVIVTNPTGGSVVLGEVHLHICVKSAISAVDRELGTITES